MLATKLIHEDQQSHFVEAKHGVNAYGFIYLMTFSVQTLYRYVFVFVYIRKFQLVIVKVIRMCIRVGDTFNSILKREEKKTTGKINSKILHII